MKLNYTGPVVLAILDGVGLRRDTNGNAVKLAHTEFLNKIVSIQSRTFFANYYKSFFYAFFYFHKYPHFRVLPSHCRLHHKKSVSFHIPGDSLPAYRRSAYWSGSLPPPWRSAPCAPSSPCCTRPHGRHSHCCQCKHCAPTGHRSGSHGYR